MKFAETPISTQQTVYLKDYMLEALDAKPGDILEWHTDPMTGTLRVMKQEAVKKK